MRDKDIEATKLDYKLSLESEKPKSWLKSVSAFGNTHGGEILFGVMNDTHYAAGLDNLLTQDHQVTNAGALLCDQGYLPQSKIICTRWKGCEKGSIDGDALDDKEFSNSSVINLLLNAEAFIRNNSKNAWTIRGMKREEKSDYAYKAVREVLVNAVIHRDYQIQGLSKELRYKYRVKMNG